MLWLVNRTSIYSAIPSIFTQKCLTDTVHAAKSINIQKYLLLEKTKTMYTLFYSSNKFNTDEMQFSSPPPPPSI